MKILLLGMLYIQSVCFSVKKQGLSYTKSIIFIRIKNDKDYYIVVHLLINTLAKISSSIIFGIVEYSFEQISALKYTLYRAKRIRADTTKREPLFELDLNINNLYDGRILGKQLKIISVNYPLLTN